MSTDFADTAVAELPELELDSSLSNSTEGMTDEEIARDSFHPDKLTWKNVDGITLVFLVAMHAGCLVAPFFFSWSAVGVMLVLHWLTCSIGICLGYHRYLAHRAFKLTPKAELLVLSCSAMAGEGTPLTWAATHRLHHQRSDLDGDPHSPFDGRFWSHILWLFVNRSPKQLDALHRRYVPDLVDKPVMQFFERAFGWMLLGVGLSLLAVGWAIGGAFGAVSMLLWGMCVRMTLAYHSTWFVNSATHLWGYRNYKTTDHSRNLWWVALLAYGEGWHNNHHAHPSLAPAGHRWWEFDMTWWAIKFLRFFGLATDVKDTIPAKTADAAAKAA